MNTLVYEQEEKGEMMSASQHVAASSRRQLIVHHLSGLEYEDTIENHQNDMLVRYQRYLGSLPVERRPDIVVITGNLTSTGKTRDLRAVATTLRICFSSWANQLHERVFIVPGPRDVSWEDSAAIGLDAFYEIFGDFALPDRSRPPSGQEMPASGQQNFIGYPIDTCYSPHELQANQEGELRRYALFYRRFAKRRDNLNERWMRLWRQPWRLRARERARVRAEQLVRLRTLFLDLVEGGQWVDLQAGRITQPDLERFRRWAQPTLQQARQGPEMVSPLKILITHHPCAMHAEHAESDTSAGATLILPDSFKQAIATAGAAGFHLALHGHVYSPQVLTDMLLFEGIDHHRPIRQIGAASLGQTGVFNEITATARGKQGEQGESEWHLDLRLVDLKANGVAGLEALSLLNPSETTDKQIKQLTRDVTQRRDFERRMQFAMRRFSEQVYRAQGANRQDWSHVAPLPQDALLLIQDVVRGVIFHGYEARVRLLLKSKEDHNAIPKLVPTYLAPAVMEGPDTLVYPASVAAWALILGRTLTYPAILSQRTDLTDHEWLQRTAKIEPVLAALKALMQEALAKSYPGKEALERYEAIHTNLEAIRGATTGASDPAIAGEHIYQPVPGGSPPQSYPYFICMPYPMRPRGGAPPALPETMVLDVGVRRVEQADGHQVAHGSSSADPFTPERIEMLETVAELIGLVLTTASALGRPRGVWDDRILP